MAQKTTKLLTRCGAILAAALFLLASSEIRGETSKPGHKTGRIYFLNWVGQILSVNDDGSDFKVLLTELKTGPDGIVVDASKGHVYWTNMGEDVKDDGSIQRIDLDGRNITTIVPSGGTFTPKQLVLDEKDRKLYWSDREGMRVMRANMDGSHVETLIITGEGEEARKDARNWCVGIAVDLEAGKIYWSQKGASDSGTGSIRRANIEIPKGQNAAHRKDIEVLFDGLPEPIDLALDLKKKMIYWADRGDLPGGNTINRAPMNPQNRVTPRQRTDIEILVRDLNEGIGIALDLHGGRMFFSDTGHRSAHVNARLYSANLDGSNKKVVAEIPEGVGTGVAYLESAP